MFLFSISINVGLGLLCDWDAECSGLSGIGVEVLEGSDFSLDLFLSEILGELRE